MKNLWTEKEAKIFSKNRLSMRVYSSRLLGRNPELVLHGGGNTSVKGHYKNIFNERIETLFIKGSGWDLVSIEEDGFAPVDLNHLLSLAGLESLSDKQMVIQQRLATLKPSAPNPSVEAILHALIPYTFVDHTHADAVLAVTNSLDGRKKINDISTVDVATKSIYRYAQDTFSVSINYACSYSNFVFYKESDFFKSSLLAIMQIYDIKNDSIILQESLPIDITLPHNLYKKTKSNEKQIIFIKDDNRGHGAHGSFAWLQSIAYACRSIYDFRVSILISKIIHLIIHKNPSTRDSYSRAK